MAEKKNLYYIERVVFAIIICILSNVSTPSSIGPISWDECGYIGQAAFLAGVDWNGVVQQFPYYSFGNGLLVQLLFRIIDNTTILYQTILFLNSLLLVGVFLLCENIIKEIYSQIKEKDRIFIAFVITCYPSNLAYSDYLITETYITFAFWLSIFALIHYIKKGKIRFLVLFEISLIWIFFIHQRTLGVCVAGAIAILFQLFNKTKIKIKHLLSFVVGLGLFYLCIKYKDAAKSVLWPVDTTMSNINDFEGYTMTQVELLLGSIDSFLKLILGKVWYIAIATFGIAFWGFAVSCMYIKNNFKSEKNGLVLMHLYIVLSMIFCMGIVSVTMFWPSRIDHIIMGRYMDALIGPCMLVGVCDFWIRDNISDLKNVVMGTIGGILFLGKTIEVYAIEVMERTTWNEVNSNVAIISFLTNPYEKGTYIKITLLFMMLFLGVYYLSKKNKKLLLYGMLLLFIPQAMIYHKGVIELQKSINYKLSEIVKIVDVNQSEVTIGYFPINQVAAQVQFMIPEAKIYPIVNPNEFNINEYEYIFVNVGGEVSEHIKNNYIVIIENEVGVLYKKIIFTE